MTNGPSGDARAALSVLSSRALNGCSEDVAVDATFARGSVASVCFDETPAADFNFVVQREKRAACSRDASTTAITKYSDWFICGF